MTEYARSRVAYQEFRRGFGGLAKANGFKRVPHTEAAWYKDTLSGDKVEFWLLCSPWGSSDTGSEFDLYLHHGKLIGNAKVGMADGRSTSFTALLSPEDLNEMQEIQNMINARRPFPQEPFLTPESDLYSYFIAHFQPVKTPYVDRIGSQIPFSYYSVEDLTVWIDFVASRILSTIQKFEAAPGCVGDALLKLITGR